MSKLPDDVAAALVRGIGAYIREVPAQELPAPLRRFRSFRPQALTAHRQTLLEVLEDDALRARIGHWLESEKPPITKQDVRLLGVATARADGWEDELRGAAKKDRPSSRRPTSDADDRFTVERDKARKAKDDLKKARDELRELKKETDARIAELEAKLAESDRRAAAAEKDADIARAKAERALEKAERSERKSKSAVEKADARREEALKESRDLRKKLAGQKAKAPDKPRRPAPAEPSKPAKPKHRRPLRVPKGRLHDDPATLETWLARDDVRLVIDGYNVAKADGGYGDLHLESQRERLVDDLFRLARMTQTETLVVFDAQKVPGRRTRRARRPVVIEWSNTGQIADDYIVARVEEMPPDPVVLVTNDKELQQRGRELDATIATSQQLLSLIR